MREREQHSTHITTMYLHYGTRSCTHASPTHLDLDFLYHGMDVQHGTVAGTDNGLVLQDGDLGIEHLSHVAGVGGVTQNEARRDVLGLGRRSTDKHTTPALINDQDIQVLTWCCKHQK